MRASGHRDELSPAHTGQRAMSAGHYARPGLINAIRDGIAALGKTPDTVTIDDLAPVDEFHIGGRRATAELLARMGLTEGQTVLDVGCGLGGAARFASHRYRCRVEGVDLTNDYVEAGNEITRWLKLDARVTLRCADALALPFPVGFFDAGYMLHVGMNVANKEALFRGVAQVVKAGASFAVYDVMRLAAGTLAFPVPWATINETSAVATPDEYRNALRRAGFEIVSECNRRDFAVQHFARQQQAIDATGEAPPLGLQTLMGARRKAQVRNMMENISNGLIAPVEIIARRGSV